MVYLSLFSCIHLISRGRTFCSPAWRVINLHCHIRELGREIHTSSDYFHLGGLTLSSAVSSQSRHPLFYPFQRRNLQSSGKRGVSSGCKELNKRASVFKWAFKINFQPIFLFSAPYISLLLKTLDTSNSCVGSDFSSTGLRLSFLGSTKMLSIRLSALHIALKV